MSWISKPDTVFRDQRAHERREATWGLTYLTKKNERGEGFTRNVSGGGVRFVAQHALQQGDEIELNVMLP